VYPRAVPELKAVNFDAVSKVTLLPDIASELGCLIATDPAPSTDKETLD
jgi:hypothetical protein